MAPSFIPEDNIQLSSDVSVKAFTSSLAFNSGIGIAIFVAFCIVRHWSKKIYQPRTYLVNKDLRPPELPPGIFTFVTASFKVKDTELLDKVGLDAYMFLRFLRMSAMFFAGCTLLSIPILIPINMKGGINGKGLQLFNIGNVNTQWRLWFHLTLTYIFTASAIGLLWREMHEYTRRRHAFLLSEKHGKTPQATTILVTAIPKGLNSEIALYNIFNRFPGGVAKIWINRHTKNLMNLCKERNNVVKELEMAEYKYIRSAYKKRSKNDPPIKEPQRPIGKTSRIPCRGERVDLVEYNIVRLCRLNQQIEEAQRTGSLESLNSAFIQFRSQFAAHSAVQTVVHPKPFMMAPIYAEISPLNVVWDNMSLDSLARKGRYTTILVASTAMILLWTIPTIFISSLATISDIVSKVSFLAFLEKLPTGILGIIQGILPPLLLAGLMALLPVLLTMMATYEGHVRYSDISLSVMSKYFFFLVTNVLLISTLSGGIIKTWEKLTEDSFRFDTIIRRFSENLPNASTFFITYVLLRALTGPALELLQIIPLLLNLFFTRILAKSPRQIWSVQGRLESVNYGILFPPQTLMFCIGIVYATMAPLILPFVTLYFTLHYFVFRHQFLYVYLQPFETGGLAFPKAVKQVFTGIFISQITLFGIFLMKQADANFGPAVPQLVLLGILFVCTALALSNMNEAFNPLVEFLPVALFSDDLHVDQDGVVTDSTERATKASRHLHDEEAVRPNDDNNGAIMRLDNLSRDNLTSERFPLPEDNAQPRIQTNKQEQDDNNELEDGYSMRPVIHEDTMLDYSTQSFRHRHPYTNHLTTLSTDHERRRSLYKSMSAPDDGFKHSLHPSSPETSKLSLSQSAHQLSPQLKYMPMPMPTQQEDSKRPSLRSHYFNDGSPRSLARPMSFLDRPPSFMMHRRRQGSFVDRPGSIWVDGSSPPSQSRYRFPPQEQQYQQQQCQEQQQRQEQQQQQQQQQQSVDGVPIARGPEDIELERLQDQAYCHPAIYNVQKPVWLPMDQRGIVQGEIDRLTSLGIVVATDGAILNGATAKAQVGGIIYAPGEEIQYRLERGE